MCELECEADVTAGGEFPPFPLRPKVQITSLHQQLVFVSNILCLSSGDLENRRFAPMFTEDRGAMIVYWTQRCYVADVPVILSFRP